MNDQQIEQEIQAKGLTAPRVTPCRHRGEHRQRVTTSTAEQGQRSLHPTARMR